MNLGHKLVLAFADESLVKLPILNIGEQNILLNIFFLQPVHFTSAQWTPAVVKYLENGSIVQDGSSPVDSDVPSWFNRIPVKGITGVASLFCDSGGNDKNPRKHV